MSDVEETSACVCGGSPTRCVVRHGGTCGVKVGSRQILLTEILDSAPVVEIRRRMHLALRRSSLGRISASQGVRGGWLVPWAQMYKVDIC